MKQSKRARDIRSKLIAAVCMLMVSVIMLTSTTYAWFTLSTAPEVKGIQTSVGANGNLEIALLSTENSYVSPDQYISSAVGDSSAAANKSALTANVTWGNLVDLSDSSYGLSLLSLLPAALQNTVALTKNNDGTLTRTETLSGQLLAVPTYGADGRVNTLTAENTIAAPYSTSLQAFSQVGDDAHPDAIRYGVRAVGTSSNRSFRETAYDTALNQAGILAAQFRTLAIGSLSSNGNGLANIGIAHANDNSATFSQADVNYIHAVIDSILGTRKYETVDGVQTYKGRADDGLVAIATQASAYYAAAAFASEMNTVTYENDAAFTQAYSDTQAILDFVASDANFMALGAAIKALRDGATTAETAMNNAGTKDSYAWSDISAAVSALFDVSQMDVWGKEISELVELSKTDEGMEQLMDLYAQNDNKIIANLKGGVFSTMATICNDFSVSTTMKLKSSLPDMPTTMVAKKTAGPLMNAVASAVSASPAPKGQGDNPSISDYYGYVVDLAFRTNASNSNLLLQTAATQRISTSSGESTMGGGSSMTFRSSDENFGTDKMAALMENIVLVFYTLDETGTTNEVLCTAKLDMGEHDKLDADGEAVTDDKDNTVREPNYTLDETSKTITANLYLVQYNYTDNGDGTYTEAKSLITTQNQAVITAMPTNTAKKVSVLVYLNGETITNADVATGNSSMTGTLNLQFSSSANLVPMNYGGTMSPANDPAGYPVAFNSKDGEAQNLAEGLAISADSTALTGRDYIFSITGEVENVEEIKAVVYEATGTNTYSEEGKEVTVKASLEPNHWEIAASDITGKLEITVKATAKETYAVTTDVEKGATFTGKTKAVKNQDYTFTVSGTHTYDVSYKIGTGEFATLTATEGVYTIPGDKITDKITIQVVAQSYNVAYTAGTGATVTANSTAIRKSDYSFTVATDTGYAVSGVSVTVGGTAVTPTVSNGTYTIASNYVTGDIVITVTTTSTT